jgi:hypothetical protein
MLEEQDLRLEVRVVNDETQPGRETYVLVSCLLLCDTR